MQLYRLILDLGPTGEQVYLVLFGPALRQCRALASVIANIGGTYTADAYAGAQGEFSGLEQVNSVVLRSLIGRGEVELFLILDNCCLPNPVRVNIK